MRWYRSFYWRIGFSFVVLVVLVLVAQSALSTYLGARPSPRSPNNLAAIIAADIGSLLAVDPAFDFARHLRQEYGTGPQLIYVVMKDGRVVANTEEPLDVGVRRSIEALLRGSREQPSMPGPPIISAPVQAQNELRGMVLLPPAPGVTPFARQIERLLSLPGTAVVILATLIAAPLVFGAARRRLRGLERAAERLGAGDPTARAPEDGGDEIAHVAAAFNRMADDLHARNTALAESDRLRRQMLADVSHELRTPLTTMLGYLDTLRMPNIPLDQQTRERYLATIERETRRLDRLVRDLLALARLQNEASALHVRLFAIEQVFKHVLARHEQEAAVLGITVRVTIDEAADQMWADPDRIEQVIENLFANALGHTPDGGVIELSATAGAGSIVLTVTDSGSGIPEEHVPHVFERFYKVDQSRRSRDGGSGLGLSIAKAIVERHLGMMHVTSRPGRTVFTVVIPDQTMSSFDVREFVPDAPRREQ